MIKTRIQVDYEKADDETLIRLVTQADEDALSTLYDRYGRLLFSIAWHIVHDQNTAEEVTLDIFSRVWEKASTYRPDRAKVSTWLTSMTRNRAIDLLRREASRPEKNSVAWGDIHVEPVSAQRDPETAVTLRLQQQRVRSAITQLPPEQQEVLALAHFRGYSHSEMAQALGQPLGTVKTRVRLAMQKLRQLLENDEI